ncbi:hypothetical protein PCANC_05893 [Puccinia coronata f. sp. avenae]|uniref:Uncharacterized protein n=1 Tax=Puccinia coronata f. sp. avenae TaxID=200324 RepID=A0A2N5VY49_9BASI|nr:hypothetical protein PCANC_09238 [Puccinia coronata f. sp. avenae]PLW54924.1 hypothetical protein PCANC_05893 [Puccinia coronata f. sp. avenae]
MFQKNCGQNFAARWIQESQKTKLPKFFAKTGALGAQTASALLASRAMPHHQLVQLDKPPQGTAL